MTDVRDRTSPAAEERAVQSLCDLSDRAAALGADVRALEERLAEIRMADEDLVVCVLLGDEIVQELSRMRSEWCRALTAAERGWLALDRIRALREKCVQEVGRAVRR